MLRKEGVKVLEKIERTRYGKFGWIMDPEGNRIELWEPPRNNFPPSRIRYTQRVLPSREGLISAVYLSLVPQESQNLDPGRLAWPHFWQVTPIGDP